MEDFLHVLEQVLNPQGKGVLFFKEGKTAECLAVAHTRIKILWRDNNFFGGVMILQNKHRVEKSGRERIKTCLSKLT